MESMKIKAQIGNDRIVTIELPPEFANEELEIVIRHLRKPSNLHHDCF